MGATHSIRMADGNSATVHIKPLVRYTQTVTAVNNLHSERFVEFPEIEAGSIIKGRVVRPVLHEAFSYRFFPRQSGEVAPAGS